MRGRYWVAFEFKFESNDIIISEKSSKPTAIVITWATVAKNKHCMLRFTGWEFALIYLGLGFWFAGGHPLGKGRGKGCIGSKVYDNSATKSISVSIIIIIVNVYSFEIHFWISCFSPTSLNIYEYSVYITWKFLKMKENKKENNNNNRNLRSVLYTYRYVWCMYIKCEISFFGIGIGIGGS